MKDGCVFCDYEGPSEVLATFAMESGEVFVIAPVEPVTEGHVLVIPRLHVASFALNPRLTGAVMHAASHWQATKNGYGDANLITSAGEAATQTVKHLHVHVVPRAKGDGLLLPWSGFHLNTDPYGAAWVERD